MIQREDKQTRSKGISNTCPSSLLRNMVVCNLARLTRSQMTVDNHQEENNYVWHHNLCCCQLLTDIPHGVWLCGFNMNFELYLRVYISEKWRGSFPSVLHSNSWMLLLCLPAKRNMTSSLLDNNHLVREGSHCPGSSDLTKVVKQNGTGLWFPNLQLIQKIRFLIWIQFFCAEDILLNWIGDWIVLYSSSNFHFSKKKFQGFSVDIT